MEINTNGEIWLIDPKQPMVTDCTFVSLEGITFDNADDGSCQTC